MVTMLELDDAREASTVAYLEYQRLTTLYLQDRVRLGAVLAQRARHRALQAVAHARVMQWISQLEE